MSWQLAIDTALIVMLALAVGTIIRFERRMALVRRSQQELDQLAATFRDATARAEDGISRLKDQSASLQQQNDVAGRLISDLQDLIERGTTLADRLEGTVRQGRKLPPSPAPRPSAPLRPDSPPRSAAERTLLQALQASGLAE